MNPDAALHQTARQVLNLYPALLGRGAMTFLGNHGGHSGARLWQLDTPGGLLCLRASPSGIEESPVAVRQKLMALARASGLRVVPQVFATRQDATAIQREGRIWELMEWMPGRADFRVHPGEARLTAACATLARLHQAWAETAVGGMALPAVERRLRAATRPGVVAMLRSSSLLDEARRLFDQHAPHIPSLLAPWQHRRGNWPMCLRDVWYAHLLFTGDELTGLVDFASVGPDSVAVDVARMLGSMVEDDEDGWRVGLAAYRQVRDLSLDEERLARVLDWTGVVGALRTWIERGEEGRLADLVKRVRGAKKKATRGDGWPGEG